MPEPEDEAGLPALRPTIRLSPATLQDIRDILLWSLERFGEEAARRYRALLIQALRDLAANPLRTGSKGRPELHPGARTCHIAFSRATAPGMRVRTPRHFILYRTGPAGLEIARILHERCDLARHRPADWQTETLALPPESQEP